MRTTASSKRELNRIARGRPHGGLVAGVISLLSTSRPRISRGVARWSRGRCLNGGRNEVLSLASAGIVFSSGRGGLARKLNCPHRGRYRSNIQHRKHRPGRSNDSEHDMRAN